jgi:hypothetical protein
MTRNPGSCTSWLLAKRIRDEVDLMTESRQRADAVVFAERRPARLEERLGRDHQDTHSG